MLVVQLKNPMELAGRLSCRMVRSLHTPVSEFTALCPWIVMPFVMVRVELQAAVPAGTITVSPSAADAMARLTSVTEGLAALIILACIALEAPTNKMAKTELRTA